jgi:aminoglycoside phosphotransferase (APT) family kinase protein
MVMTDHSKLIDIPNYNTWKYIKQINQGFSDDLKYYIRDKYNREFFLRLSDSLLYDRKKQEHEIINTMTKLGVPSLQEIDFGNCDRGKSVYMLQTWIKGEILETALPTLSEDEQYKLGVGAGKILKKIHSIKSADRSDWYSIRMKQYLSSYKQYKEYGINYKYEKEISEYINRNVSLLKEEQVCLVHGDYHVGNMILSPGQKIIIIDFDRFDWKAPIEDFYKLAVFSRNISIPFCNGQIDGYTDNNPSSEFWQKYCLYIAMTSFLSLLWGKMRSEEMYMHRKRLCDILIQDHNCFQDMIPKWYSNINY